MSFRPWAKAERKEWLPEEGPYVILADIPPGKPSVLKPDLTKCLSIKTMKDSVEKLKIRMSMSEREWWPQMVQEEEQKVNQWNTQSPEEYATYG